MSKVHYLVESKAGEIKVGCGASGKPYGYDKTGLKSTVWVRDVTCPICRRLPGVTGRPPTGVAAPDDKEEGR